MKKILFAIALTTASLSVASTKLVSQIEINNVNYLEVNTFCKLIKQGNYDAVKAMIESGENINKKSTGLTPLMFAARYNRAKIAKLLIDNGAKLNIKSERGSYTALKWAELSKATETIEVIKAAIKK